MNYNPLLLIDFYKATHSSQYPPSVTTIASTWTPRLNRFNNPKDTIPHDDRVCFFGLQGYIHTFLDGYFKENFFDRPLVNVVKEYDRILTNTLGPDTYDSDKIVALHKLGYLPIAIYAVPEGMRTKIGVPQCVIVNTHPDFAWLTNTLESAFSAYMWHIQVAAEVGHKYRIIVNNFIHTCDDDVLPQNLLSDFSMRGQQSPESAITSSAAWLLSFNNTVTVPAIMWLEDNYYCSSDNYTVGKGLISTEHSVMCSNFALDGEDEAVFVKRLLTEIYPHSSFSMVCDSYDYNNFVENVLPQCRDEIEKHEGFIGIRGDSGDPVDVVAGLPYCEAPWVQGKESAERQAEVYIKAQSNFNENHIIVQSGGIGYICDVVYTVDGSVATIKCSDVVYAPCVKYYGTVYMLADIFGYTYNSKGYKVLNPKVKAVYGDSITFTRCEKIYSRLKEKGFAINNVSLGVGSFSFMCKENADGSFSPYTRDTFGFAIKSTYIETKEGREICIYKRPKADSWKASQMGCPIVKSNGMSYTDGHSLKEMVEDESNLLKLVWKDGKQYEENDLYTVRNNIYR